VPKRIALSDYVGVNSVDLSDFARSVDFDSEHARIDVSGFNPSGANEYLAGPTTQSVTVEFFGSYGSGEVHQTLWPIHQARSIVPFAWRPNQNNPVSATNPELRGNVQILKYPPKAQRGSEETIQIEFASPDASLAFVSIPATGATAGTPGSFTPTGATPPANLAGLTGITASPSSAWTTGQYIVLGDGSHAHWSGTAWVSGNA
jgi:hypothetical protein